MNSLDAQRQQLLTAKTGTLLTWKVPALEHTIGPCDPTAFQAYEDKRASLVNQCCDKLRRYSEQEIASLLSPHATSQNDLIKDWREFLRQQIEHLLSRPLPWYAGGFGHPDHVADFDYWSKMPRFSTEELTCLTIGIEPADFPASAVARLQKQDFGMLWPSLQFLLKRYEQLERQFSVYGHSASTLPNEFLEWVDKVEFKTHPEFLRLLRKYHPAVSSAERQQSPAPSPKPDKREIDKIAQLFTALAIDGYGFKPFATRSPIPKEIAEIAASMGLSISDDTIRKYLKLGATFLPPDWEPEKN